MSPIDPLIHVATIRPQGPREVYLFLRQLPNKRFCWFEERTKGREVATPLQASSLHEALHRGKQHWKKAHFQLVQCGFRFSLPERDEIGRPAFFSEMVLSYSSPTGSYSDPESGQPYEVTQAAQKSLHLMKLLLKEKRIS